MGYVLRPLGKPALIVCLASLIGACGLVFPVPQPSEIALLSKPPPVEALLWGAPGCPRQMSALYLLPDDRATVRCCSDSDTGVQCTTPNECREDTLEKAEQLCASAGQRLCTKGELETGACCQSGCDFDFKLVWTSSKVATGGAVSLLSADRPKVHLLPAHDPGLNQKDLFCKLRKAVGDVSRGMGVVGMPWMHMPMTYSKCAVVGSSGTLRLHRHGSEIDGADMVMRFNNAPSAGFEEFVGQKTTMRVVNEKILANWRDNTDLSLLDEFVTFVSTCAICNVGTSELVNTSELSLRRRSVHDLHPGVDLYASDLEVEAKLDSFFQKTFMKSAKRTSPAGPTTGTVGMALALNICDEVRAYGIARSKEDDLEVPYNYYDEESTARKTNIWHRSWTSEKLLWRKLATNNPQEIDKEGVAVIPGFSTVECLQEVDDRLG